jgi:hypothetical protein
MKEPYVEGSSDPPRPRVMAACPQGPAVSVDRGTRRPAIELRNHPFGAPTSFLEREGNTMRGDSASHGIGPTESKTLGMRESSMHENREIPAAPDGRPRKATAGRSGKACGHNPDAHAAGKSDTSVVPRNVGNKVGMRDVDGHGGTVNPPRNRKSGAGNPPPAAGSVAWSVGPRTGGREGW